MKVLYIFLILASFGLSSCNSCQRAKEIKERREALNQNSYDELEKAKRDLYVADSISSFVEFEFEDMLNNMVVFEKEEKYQSKGFYVLKEHSGDKTGLSFFPEVEEEGQMLLVSIDSKRKWKFLKIEPVTGNCAKSLESGDVVDFVGRPLTDDEKLYVLRLSEFAEKMNKLKDAKASIEKNKMKVEYYEKKVSQQSVSLD